MGEDEFLIPRPTVFGDTGASDRMRQPQLGFRKLLQPLAIALGIFGVSTGAARYLFPRKKIQPQQQQMVQTAGRHGVMGGMGSPTTAECSTPDEVVMKGADLTSYFSLEHGTPAVFGVAEHEAVYNGYRFWFASEENRAKFEVRRGHRSVQEGVGAAPQGRSRECKSLWVSCLAADSDVYPFFLLMGDDTGRKVSCFSFWAE